MRVKIVKRDGAQPAATELFDADTGELLADVTSYLIFAHLQNPEVQVTLFRYGPRTPDNLAYTLRAEIHDVASIETDAIESQP